MMEAAEPSPAAGAGSEGAAFLSPALRSTSASIRLRLALIVLIAGIPLSMLSASIAWQNYQLALNATAEKASRLRDSASARHLAAVVGTHLMLDGLAVSPDIVTGDPAECHRRLSRLLKLRSDRYRDLAAFSAAGKLLCIGRDSDVPLTEAATQPEMQRLLDSARAKTDFTLGPLQLRERDGGAIVPAVDVVLSEGKIAGYLYAGLRQHAFAAPGIADPDLPSLWLVDRSGRVSRIMGQTDNTLPPPNVLAALESTAQNLEAESRGGKPYAYASEILTDSYTLFTGYPAAMDRQAARRVLLQRAGQLGLLLLLGLAGVAFGVHIALTQPMERLGAAVKRWRAGGAFSFDALDDAPAELADLAASFSAAIAAIDAQAKQLRQSEEQQALLMREIHHRVKNNLQIIASLLNLQASRIRLPEAKAEFANARDRVRALATLHRHLYIQGELHTINMHGFLHELCGQLFNAMGEPEGQRIRLVIDSSALTLPGDQAVPLSLIVTEAVTNALKYAFPAGRQGNVAVRLHAEGEVAVLIVEDDGIGIPPGQAQTETGMRDGLGITLIRGFARQLGGELAVEEVGGTRYTLRFRIHHESAEAEPAVAAG